MVFTQRMDRMISFKCGLSKNHPGSHLAKGVSRDRSWTRYGGRKRRPGGTASE
jgi:hypothetical protein